MVKFIYNSPGGINGKLHGFSGIFFYWLLGLKGIGL